MTKFFVEVHAPMDQVFVGPFETKQAAEQYAGALIKEKGYSCYTMTEQEKQLSVDRYGALPIQAP
jgi:hypothetical protein